MLEKFEKIYSMNRKAENKDWNILIEWLAVNHFPTTELPKDYVLLMSESNGGNYLNGQREYQFFSLIEIIEYYESYMFAKFMPFAFPFAMDGCGNFYIFNLHVKEETVYCVSAGNLGWGQEECFQLANNFNECLTQRNLLDEIFL